MHSPLWDGSSQVFGGKWPLTQVWKCRVLQSERGFSPSFTHSCILHFHWTVPVCQASCQALGRETGWVRSPDTLTEETLFRDLCWPAGLWVPLGKHSRRRGRLR